ncbi:MAG: hypothetical protein Q4G65_15815 [bacterium]|nr:hypothetical protein [bacterium]
MGATVDQGNLDVPAGAGNVEVKPVLFGVPASFFPQETIPAAFVKGEWK